MEIKDEHYSPKIMRLFINFTITIPFLVTVICCFLVIYKLRCNSDDDIQDNISEVPSNVISDHVISDHVVRPRAFTRSASTSNSKLSNTCILSRENSQQGNFEQQSSPESPSKALNIFMVRTSSRDWLRETSREWVRGTLSRLPISRDRQFSRSQSHLQDTGSSRRASITITIITIAFIISYGPYMFLWVYSLLVHELQLFGPVVTTTSTHWWLYLYIYLISTTLLSTFNSCIFPLIYFIRIKGNLSQRFRDFVLDKWTLLREGRGQFNLQDSQDDVQV